MGSPFRITNVQVWVGPGSDAGERDQPAGPHADPDGSRAPRDQRAGVHARDREQFYPKFDDCYVCFQMWLDGKRDAVKALFAQKALAGVNMTRVFGMC